MNEMAIDRNRQALKRLLAVLFVYIGLADDTGDAMRQTDGPARAARAMRDPMTISRRVHRMILALLIPVEAATRRLIIALAGRLSTPKLRPSQIVQSRTTEPTAGESPSPLSEGVGDGSLSMEIEGEPTPRPPRFALGDPFKRYLPSGSEFPASGFVADPDKADDPLPDTNLMRRIAALAFALNDLSAQARRFARWRASWRRGVRLSPLRPGFPPGAPKRSLPKSRRLAREEHQVLAETHGLAREALRFDSS